MMASTALQFGRRALSSAAAPVVAIVGSTGAVGQELITLMEERSFAASEVRLLASARSAGKTNYVKGHGDVVVQELTEDSFAGVDIAYFSAGGGQSLQYAPIAGKAGCVVIDNSSAFRMDPECPLVVPEINGEACLGDLPKNIIANPNCSTILALMCVYPIHKAKGVKRMVVSTYQAASGAGAVAMAELEQQAADWVAKEPITQDFFGRQYVFNLFSHNSDIDAETGYNEEELKMVKETHKILNDTSVAVTATCIRVPVLRAHCESINLELEQPCTVEEAHALLDAFPGVTVQDDRVANIHPEPLSASGVDDCLVGRVRNDISRANPAYGLDMFMAGDQIRKGAALNAIQIAELLVANRK